MNRRVVVLALALVTIGSARPALSAAVQLTESGSTLLYPLMTLWASTYRKADPAVQIDTAATGSGAGIAQALSGHVTIGGSDAYLNDKQIAGGTIANIPVAVSAQQINYNVPEIGKDPHLNLSAPVLAGIYSGTVAWWDDPKIVAMNGALAGKLPHKRIIPVRRNDSSGDTFLFTQYLSATVPAWKTGPGAATHVTSPAVDSMVATMFNRGVLDTLHVSAYSIGYVGISYLRQSQELGLGYAALQNRSGKFVLPTTESMKAAVASMTAMPSDQRLSLVNAPADTAYPIVNFEYAIVRTKQPNAEVAGELRKFLIWAISPTGGNANDLLDQVSFIALPPDVAEKSKAQIAKIQ